LIWPATFSDRLESWNQLRDQTQYLPLESALLDINNWWFRCPWKPYYLHWDDQPNWPDPWQLLSDNVYCEVARGLGILYTITLLERADMAPADLILTEDGTNLVLVSKGSTSNTKLHSSKQYTQLNERETDDADYSSKEKRTQGATTD
jgi:hypothetical protein